LAEFQQFMKFLFNNNLFQFDILMPWQFLEFLKQRGINVSLRELEDYDREGIYRPALRIHRQKRDSSKEYEILMTDSHNIKDII